MIAPGICLPIIAQARCEAMLVSLAAGNLYDAESTLCKPINLGRVRQGCLFAARARLLTSVVAPGKQLTRFCHTLNVTLTALDLAHRYCNFFTLVGSFLFTAWVLNLAVPQVYITPSVSRRKLTPKPAEIMEKTTPSGLLT